MHKIQHYFSTPARKLIIAMLLVAGATTIHSGLGLCALVMCSVMLKSIEPVHLLTNKITPEIIAKTGFIAVIFGFLNYLPAAQDDLLRYLVAYKFNYDYSKIFAYSLNIPTFDPYILFDHVVGWVHSKVGLKGSMHLVQLILIAGSLIVIWKSIKKETSSESILWVALLLLDLVLLSQYNTRLISARPEAFYALIGLTALILPMEAWVVLMVGCSLTYWLFWIYAPLAFLLRTSFKKQVLAFIVVIIGGTVSWWLNSGFEFVRFWELTQEWVKNREIAVLENNPFFELLLGSYPLFIFITVLTWVISASKKWDTRLISYGGLVLFYLLPDMNRYSTVVLPLLLIFIVRLLELNKLEIKMGNLKWVVSLTSSANFKIALMLGVVYTGMASMSGWMQTADYPYFKLPLNSTVLVAQSPALYATVALNPGVKVAPAFEVGASDKKIQVIIKTLNQQGTLDCNALKQFEFTHLIEANLREIPHCLELAGLSRNHRLWKVRNEPK